MEARIGVVLDPLEGRAMSKRAEPSQNFCEFLTPRKIGRCTLLGVEQTFHGLVTMSAFDPKRTSGSFSMRCCCKLASSEFEKWSILNRLGCQIGSDFQSWALFIPLERRVPEDPSRRPLVGVCQCGVCVLSPANIAGLNLF